MFRLIRWGITLVVLVVAFVVGDRVLVHMAEQRVAVELQADAHLTSRPTVTIHGFPFVTQVARGRYTDIDVDVDDLFDTGEIGGSGTSASQAVPTPGQSRGSTLHLELRGVHISLGKVLSNKVSSVAVDQVYGTLDTTFADLEYAANVPGLTLAPGGQAGEVSATESLTVGGVKASATVVAELSTAGHTITAKATKVSILSLHLSPAVLTALQSKAGFSVTVPGVPPGLTLGAVSVGVNGVTLPVAQTGLVMTR